MATNKHMNTLKIYFPLILIASCFLYLQPSFGQPYSPPQSPELYDSEPAQSPPRKINSHAFIGANLGVGQSQSTGKENPSASILYGVQAGYLYKINSFSLLEADAQILGGQVGHQFVDLNLLYGVLFRVGFGGTMSSNMFWLAKVGAGVAESEYKGGNQAVVLSGETLASLIHFSWLAGVSMSPGMDIVGGLEITQVNASYSNLKADSGVGLALAGGADNVVVNALQFGLGIRFAL